MPVLSRLLIKNWYFALYWSLACKYILSIFGCRIFRLNNEFVFLNPGPLIFNILYGGSGICSQFGLCSFVSSFITFFVSFYFIVTLNLFFSLTRILLVPYAYIPIEPTDCILLLSFKLKEILSIFSEKLYAFCF